MVSAKIALAPHLTSAPLWRAVSRALILVFSTLYHKVNVPVGASAHARGVDRFSTPGSTTRKLMSATIMRALLALVALAVHAHAMSIALGKTNATVSDKLAALGSSLPLLSGYLNLGLYYMNVSIGTPPVPYRVNIDTGSSTFGIYSQACAQCASAPSANTYSIARSSTETLVACSDPVCVAAPGSSASRPRCLVGDTEQGTAEQCAFTVLYGDKSTMQGVLTRDVVTLGNSTATAYFGRIQATRAQNNAVGLFVPTGVDGIFGLGPAALNCAPACTPTVLDAFAAAGLLSPYVFAVCLTPTGGTVDFGVVDPRKFTGELAYLPTLAYPAARLGVYYTVVMSSSAAGGTLLQSQPQYTIVDTGSTLLLVSAAWFDAFKAVVLASSAYFGDRVLGDTSLAYRMTAAQVATWPTLSFTFPTLAAATGSGTQRGTVTVTLPPSAYLLLSQTLNGFAYYQLGVATTASSLFILGDVFLQQVYTVFDQTNGRVAFAPAANCSARVPAAAASAVAPATDPVCSCVAAGSACTATVSVGAGAAWLLPLTPCAAGGVLTITTLVVQASHPVRVYTLSAAAALDWSAALLATTGDAQRASVRPLAYDASSSCATDAGAACCAPLWRVGGAVTVGGGGNGTVGVHCLNAAAAGACSVQYSIKSACFLPFTTPPDVVSAAPAPTPATTLWRLVLAVALVLVCV